MKRVIARSDSCSLNVEGIFWEVRVFLKASILWHVPLVSRKQEVQHPDLRLFKQVSNPTESLRSINYPKEIDAEMSEIILNRCLTCFRSVPNFNPPMPYFLFDSRRYDYDTIFCQPRCGELRKTGIQTAKWLGLRTSQPPTSATHHRPQEVG